MRSAVRPAGQRFLGAAQAGANVLLVASVLHFGVIAVPDLKAYLAGPGVQLARPL